MRNVVPYERLESDFASFNGLPEQRMVSCSSGTAALHLALESLQLDPGSVVAIPNYAMISVARAVSLAGLQPLLIGCKNDDLLINPTALSTAFELYGDLLRAVITVDTYGRRACLPTIHNMIQRDKRDCKVIEDLSEAHGAVPHKESDAVCWSFYQNKVISGEEGGAVYFKNKENANLCRQLKNIGFSPERDYTHIARGHNYRLANTLAQLIIDSLETYDETEWRVNEAEQEKMIPEQWRQPPRNRYWMTDIRIPGMTLELQTEVVRSLRDSGIDSVRFGFKLISSQEEYRAAQVIDWGECWRAVSEVLSFPLLPAYEIRRAMMKIQEIISKKLT